MPDYHLIMTFTADDDRQAQRLGIACAETFAVEFGTRDPVIVGTKDSELEEINSELDQIDTALAELLGLRTMIASELGHLRADLAEAARRLGRVRALLKPSPEGSVYLAPHGDWGSQEVLPAADLHAALERAEADRPDALESAIEAFLIHHRGELDADVEPALAELVRVYVQRTGWTVEDGRLQEPDGG